jgi:hypothetical protein
MTFDELKAQNSELPILQEQLDSLRSFNKPLLEEEAKCVEGKRLTYILTSYNKDAEDQEVLKGVYESALKSYQNNINNYQAEENNLQVKMISIEQQLREQSDDQAPYTLKQGRNIVRGPILGNAFS